MSTSIDTKNAETSTREVAAFHAHRPARYFAYMSHDGLRITTWMGDELAQVVDRGGQNEWMSNMGDVRRSFQCRTPDGVTYAGIAYVTAGDYCRLRRVAS